MESFEAVYEELFPQVYRYLLVLCGDRDLAEELTQETFFQAIQHIDSFRGDCKLYVWLCQIGKRKYLAGLRRQKRSGEMPDLERQPSPDQLEERLLDRESAIEIITAAFPFDRTKAEQIIGDGAAPEQEPMPCLSPIGRSFLSGYLESCPLERSLNSFPGQRAGPE